MWRLVCVEGIAHSWLGYMVEWEAGSFLGQDDAACLQSAFAQRLTLVTYDRRTIPPLLKAWAEEGRHHGGVIFVDSRRRFRRLT